MANKQDIITAINNSNLFLKVPELIGASVRFNKNGNPFVYAGGFNMVFQLTKGNKDWAFRVWHVPMGENKKRYQKIASYLTDKKLPYFADFIFDEGGLLVNGELIDTIRMEWINGLLLKDYLEENLHNSSVLNQLAVDFLKMTQELQANKISHGDLQEGNILVDKDGAIKLVDYDSICIPAIEGQKELVTGLKGYQHPSRFKGGAISLTADYFSELIIFLSIKAIAEQPSLWDKYHVKDTCYLLFTENDFEDFPNSDIFTDLQNLSLEIKKLTTVLISYLNTAHYTGLAPFSSALAPPKIAYLDVSQSYLIKGMDCIISWDIENAKTVYIANIGNVSTKGSVTISPNSTSIYILKATGFGGEIEEEIKITILPVPITEAISIPKPDFVHQRNFSVLQYLPSNKNASNELGGTNFFSPPSFEKLSSGNDELKKLIEEPKFNFSKTYNELKSKFFK